ncbi:uncharacterized protein LOC124171528 [Ischnura elegans]|uniref:uncharacterized protein LOC124171528 n=1 Tax=Ischnura elegans TaxID=197161 RepID=UPI001ED87470|nr:uncharacterized protein LOC124171528 [Ischnura elegans]XP_046406657.1 uncharacterized protein LOC124171528 [Ischnura elegans]XP_046406658.1 uncharacterized protein LOC124171528 [Ischnura elegans]
MDINSDRTVDSSSWTQGITRSKDVDFGTIEMGSREIALFSIVNESKEHRSYKIRRRKRARVPRYVFMVAHNKFSLKPNEEADIEVEFTPLKPFETYVDYLYVYSQKLPVAKIRLHGRSIGPFIVQSTRDVRMLAIMGTVTESQVELHNCSSAPAEMYFDIDDGNSIFRLHPARSIIQGGETIVIKIQFYPPFEGTVEKDVFCLVKYQDPIVFHLIGVCAASDYTKCAPNIIRYPGLPDKSKSRTSLEAYIYRDWEEIVDVKPDFAVVMPPEEKCTSILVTNKTDDSFTLMWSEDARRLFSISPRACYLYPKETFKFKVIKNIADYGKLQKITAFNNYEEVGPQLELDGDMAVSATIDGWLFWHKPKHSLPSCSEPWRECQIFSNSEWLESLTPLNFEMTFIGQYVHNRNCLPQMECIADPSTLVFPIKGCMQDNFSSLFIQTKSCHLVNYEIIAPKTGEFTVKPKQGLVNQQFRYIGVHHTPRFLHVTYMERWNVALNGIVIDKTQVNLIAVISTINVFFGDVGDTINFAPAMVGCMEATHFTVRNDSPLWIELSCSTSARPSVLNVGRKKFIIAPHDNAIQKWEYCPRVCGYNYELVTITAKVISSPALRKIMEKGNGYYEEENNDFSPAGMNVCSKHSIEHGDGDFESYQKEYTIYAEILCRNTFPQMEPSCILIDDFIATHPAVGSFRLTNDTDARIPYRLLLQLECSTNGSLENCMDHSLLIDQSNYEISPSQGTLEPYQSVNYTCVVFNTKMCPETYSLIMEVKQILDNDMSTNEEESTPLSKKLGTITCKGAWPKVKIVDILASKNDEFFNPFLLWKSLDLDRFNEDLQSNPDGNVKNINMRFPGQPLGSPPIYYRMKLQNLSHLPISWDVQIQHGDIEMPPSLKVAPEISDESSRSNDGLKHLIALIQHQQNEALNLNDSSFLRTIQCCPRREQKTLDSPAHGTPSSSEECPLLSVIRILPEKGTIMPAKSEIISVEVHHELEGDFSFQFLINFTMPQEDISVHQKQDILSEIQFESEQLAMMSTGPQYNMSSDEFETHGQAEDCRTLYKCKDPLHHQQEDTMVFHCVTNEACASKNSFGKGESSIDERETNETLLHTLWGPEFILDSTSGDESTSSLSECDWGNELRFDSREIKAQGVTNIVHSAILHSSSEEEIPKSKSLPPTSSRGASGLPLADKIFKKRRHSAPEPEIHQWDIQTPQIMHSLSVGNMRVPRKSSTKTSSSNSDSGSDTANYQSCYSKEEPKRKPKRDKMKVIRKIMTKARSGKMWAGWRKFFQSDPSAGPFEQQMEFESLPKGRNSNAAEDRDANKVCDAFYEAQNKVPESQDGTKKRRKRRRSKKHNPKRETNEKQKHSTKSTKEKGELAASKIQDEEYRMSETNEKQKNSTKSTKKKGELAASKIQDEEYRMSETNEKQKNSTKSTKKKGESAASKIQDKEYRISETKESRKNSTKSTKKKGGSVASKIQDEEELKRISLMNGQVKQEKSPSKNLKKKRKRQGYKSPSKPKQCIPLGNDSESYESETEICGKVSGPKVLTDSILETIWAKYEKSSESPLYSQRQSNQTSTTESDEDSSKEDKNEQMIFDGMVMRGSFCPDTKTASKFNLCQLTEFQSTKVKDHTTVSRKKQRVMEHIIDDLAMENEQEGPRCASGIVIQRRSLLAQFPSVGQNGESNPNSRSTQLMGNKETMHHPPVINSFKLQLTVCAYDKEQENFGVHPTVCQ